MVVSAVGIQARKVLLCLALLFEAGTVAKAVECVDQTGCPRDAVFSATLEQLLDQDFWEYCTDFCCYSEQECYNDVGSFTGFTKWEPQEAGDCCPSDRYCLGDWSEWSYPDETTCYDDMGAVSGCVGAGECCDNQKSCSDSCGGHCVGPHECCYEETACYDDYGNLSACKGPGECCDNQKSCSDGFGDYCVGQDECCYEENTCYDDNGQLESCVSTEDCCNNERKCTDTGGYHYCVLYSCCYDEVTCVQGDGSLLCLASGECCPGEDQCPDGSCVFDKDYPSCGCGDTFPCGHGSSGHCANVNDPNSCPPDRG